jgi:peptide deformylase
MAVRPVLLYPDPRLRLKAEDVTRFDASLTRLAEDMIETMYAHEGIGLAATQIGARERMLVLDVSEDRCGARAFVNPIVVTREGRITSEEGCLSIPNVRERVERAARVRIDAYDLHGEPFTVEADGLLAVCLQHEIDHLEGRLFIDLLSSVKRERFRKRYRNAQREAERGLARG